MNSLGHSQCDFRPGDFYNLWDHTPLHLCSQERAASRQHEQTESKIKSLEDLVALQRYVLCADLKQIDQGWAPLNGKGSGSFTPLD